jgi:hypothetical protein
VGAKAAYGVEGTEVDVEGVSKEFLEIVLEHGKSRAEQVDEENLDFGGSQRTTKACTKNLGRSY